MQDHTNQPSLVLIDGDGGCKAWSRSRLNQPEQRTCPECEKRTGTASSIAVQVVLSPMELGGRMVGGTKAWVCALCLARGEIVELKFATDDQEEHDHG